MLMPEIKRYRDNNLYLYMRDDKRLCLSRHRYKYVLLYLEKKSLGAKQDGDTWRVVGFGNQAQKLFFHWKHVYFRGELRTLEIKSCVW